MTGMRATRLWVIAPWVLAACADEGSVRVTEVEDWHTVAEFEIGDRMEGDALFGFYIDVAPSADGSSIYVLDAEASEVTIWTPDGHLIRRLGRAGGGPGEFQRPVRLTLLPDGFYVTDDRRITTFTREGEVTGTAPFPRGGRFGGFPVQIWDVFDDGSFAALAAPSVLSPSSTDDPTDHLPVLRISEDGGSPRTEVLAQLDFRDWQTTVDVDESSAPSPLWQPWVTPDHFEVDHGSASVVVKRATAADPGLVELIEISTAGDTLWTRRIRLPAMPVTDEQIEAELEEWASILAENPSPMLKSRIRAAWHIPEYWPAVRQIQLMSNGEIWFEPLGRETPDVWHAVQKRADEGPIKRIAVPASFEPRDVTGTHVWGIRRDELDVGYVTGLRLLPGQQQEPK